MTPATKILIKQINVLNQLNHKQINETIELNYDKKLRKSLESCKRAKRCDICESIIFNKERYVRSYMKSRAVMSECIHCYIKATQI